MSNKLSTNQNWLVFIKQEEVAEQVNNFLQEITLRFDLHRGDLADAIPYIKKNQSTNFLLIQITDPNNSLELIDELAENCNEETRLICIGDNNDINFYRKLKNHGVDEYFTLPIDLECLKECINNLTNNPDTTQEEIKTNPLITIVGSRGGLGTSTIANSMAWLLSKHFLVNTCLLDLDIYNGISSLIFNKTPNSGLIQALANADRLDAVFLKRLAIEINKYLSILSSEQGLDKDYFITDEDFNKLIKLAQTNFDYTVIDLNYNNLYSKIVLPFSSDIIIVSDFSIPSIRDTAKILDICKIKAPFAKIKIINIKNNIAKSAELTQPQFEDGIQRTIDLLIPFDRKATLEALNLGVVFSDKFPQHTITKKLRELITIITKSSIQEPKLSWLEKLKNWKL
ncbi:MAG: hypothetical protein HRT87_05545 [Legionellales bacterium]|nr:hypothetical protein [Legionellales bacterium]